MIETSGEPVACGVSLAQLELRERYPHGQYGDQPVPAGVELLDPVWRAPGALAVVRANHAQLRAVHCFGMDVLPDLLQTDAYCGALMHDYDPGRPPEPVRLLVDPQHLFAQQSEPVYSFVIDEAALRRPVGGTAVMGAQLRHLLACAELPYVTVQVMPCEWSCHLALTRPTLVCVGVQETWVFGDGAYGLTWLPDLTTAVPLIEAYHRMRAHALPSAESAAVIRQAASDLAASRVLAKEA